MSDDCRAYEVDGEPVRVHGGGPLDEAGQEALGAIVHAAKAKLADIDPHLGIRQELMLAGMAAARCLQDAELKARLRAALIAARDALTPPKETNA